jgi:DNA-binding FadR family transcriptional regulator
MHPNIVQRWRKAVTAVSTNDAPARPALGHNLTLGLVDVLGHAIIAGEFPRGVLPTEPELERRFAVSRTVVREAVKMLAAKGLVVTRPRHGTVIEPNAAWNLFDPLVLRWMVEGMPAPGMLRQLCEFSMSMEPSAAALAALSGSAVDISGVVAACGRLCACDPHPSARREAAAAFHKAIVVASGNVFYLTIGDAIGAAHRVLLRHNPLTNPPLLARHYRAVANAIEMRAPERSRHEMAELLALVFEPIAGRPAAA